MATQRSRLPTTPKKLSLLPSLSNPVDITLAKGASDAAHAAPSRISRRFAMRPTKESKTIGFIRQSKQATMPTNVPLASFLLLTTYCSRGWWRTGTCAYRGAGEGCGVFIKKTNKKMKGPCTIWGVNMKRKYDEIRMLGCKACGRAPQDWQPGCEVKIDYVHDCEG